MTLPLMPLGEHVVNDYRSLSLSLKAHPVSFLRRELAARRHRRGGTARRTAERAARLRRRPRARPPAPGHRVGRDLRHARGRDGRRQHHRLAEDFRALSRRSCSARGCCRSSGRLQSEQGVIHVVAERLEDYSPLLSLLSEDPSARTAWPRPTRCAARSTSCARSKQNSAWPACSPPTGTQGHVRDDGFGHAEGAELPLAPAWPTETFSQKAEQPEQENDRKRNPDQPKQCTASHENLHFHRLRKRDCRASVPHGFSGESPPSPGRALADRLAPVMAPARHELLATHEDAIDRLAAGCEYPGVEERVAARPEQCPVVGIERHDVGGCARRDARRRRRRAPPPRRQAPRRTARGRSSRPRPPCTLRARSRSRCAYSSWRSSSATSIRMLESEPMPKRPPRYTKRGAVEDAVAEIGFGDRTEPATAPVAASPRVSASVMCVAWMRHQRRSTSALSSSHSTGRAPDQARQSSHLLHLLGDVDVDRPPRASARHRAISSGVTARRLCGATPSAAPGKSRTAAAARLKQPRIDIEVGDEAPLPGDRRRAAETRMRIKDRQQRQPDAGLARPPRRCAPPSRRYSHRAVRRDRGADSGTRRRA